MLGRDDEYVAALERAFEAYRQGDDIPAAARCTWWLGHNMLFRGDSVRAEGWFAIGRRLLDEAELDCVERGYLLAPTWLRQMGDKDWARGLETARAAEAIALRFTDPDLVWLARDDQARALISLGQVDEGLRLVNELLVVVGSGELSPVMSGIVYCNTIVFCRDAHALRHTREWTDALVQWCERQPQMVAHNGLCLVHRAEILQLQGDWPLALDEAVRAAELYSEGALNRIAVGPAHYRRAEILRLQGRHEEAEQAYREASSAGYEPQPGVALLRLQQGKKDAAASAIRRVVTERSDPLERAELLPAYVDIMVSQGDLDAARAACVELTGVAERQGVEAMEAVAARARAQVAIAGGEAREGLVVARRSLTIWQSLGAVLEAARARVNVAQACALLDDEDSADLELATARQVFADLGAAPDVARVDTLIGRAKSLHLTGLSPRELEVLRLVCEGGSNRAIAARLVISERTVARHLQNIFVKLGVSTRTAASKVAHERGMF
jgi:DNA-binding NarL/FixJ family response regulator